jgi:hypothetical protein
MPPSDRPWWQRGPALPLLVSAAAHGLLLLFLAEVPWRQAARTRPEIDTRVVVELATLSLAPDDPQPEAPAARGTPGAAEEAEGPPPFSVRVADPPRADSQETLPAPTIAMPAPSAGTPSLPGTAPAKPGPVSAGPGQPHGGGSGGRFFADLPDGESVVYVIDRSLSMGPSQAWARARQELLTALDRLSPGSRFQVIPYNREAEPLRVNGRQDLLPADAGTLSQARQALLAIQPSGGTDHVKALSRGLALRPDHLFFVTDSDELSPGDVNTLTRFNQGQTALHVLSLGVSDGRSLGPLRRLAGMNRGTYRQVSLR